jgi:hypothetical protein
MLWVYVEKSPLLSSFGVIPHSVDLLRVVTLLKLNSISGGFG